ncbi:MAG: hypothetical protein V1777_02755 [Candidatus Micrarchaeota archaeon]
MQLFSKWRVWLLIIALAISVFGIVFSGLSYGIDFKGGTSFQVKLAKPAANAQEKEQIRSIIEQRLNFTGLRDATVSFAGEDVVFADIAETDPEQVKELESLLLRQGKFEATLDGQVLFTGSDFVRISKDAASGYGIRPSSAGGFEWSLPFILKPSAAKRFAELTFHQCDLIGTNSAGQPDYECKFTYFFIDRPDEAIVIFTDDQRTQDEETWASDEHAIKVPSGLTIDDLIENAGIPVIAVDENNFDQNTDAELLALRAKHPNAVVPDSASIGLVQHLESLGFSVLKTPGPASTPFIWNALGTREIIRLNPGVTGLDPYVSDVKDVKVLSELQIQGSAATSEVAQKNLDSLTILLQSGSLPIAVRDIGKETVSPFLGQEFLQDAVWMGVLALLMVMLIIFVRYREIPVAIALGFTSLCEVIVVLGFASFVNWNLDLASIAGIIAAIGTGVNQQIIITDEIRRGSQTDHSESIISRTKRALYIILASASTVLATMLPIIFLGFGLGKLVGFAVTTIAGVAVGLLITRPAFSDFAQYYFGKKNKSAD